MRDLANKMAELKFEAPLAQFEETDEWGPVDFQSATTTTAANINNTTQSISMKSAAAAAMSDTLNLNLLKDVTTDNQSILILEEAIKDNCIGMMEDVGGIGGKRVVASDSNASPNCNSLPSSMANVLTAAAAAAANGRKDADNFAEQFSGSLEDLVNTFDEKITKCFGNYEQSVEEMAPVQVRSQEEIMNECQ